MKLRRLSVLLLIFLLLLAAFLLQRQRLSPRVAVYAVKPSMAADFRLFVRTKNKTRMANVSAYYYQSGLDPGVVQDPLSIASFTTPAPLIYDGSVGDTSTGYNMVSASGSHYGMVWVLADLGSLQTVTQWEFSAVILNGFPVSLFKLYYWNGSAWVQADSTFAGSTTTGGITRGVTTTSARYWQAVFASGLTSFVSVATDFRLYDGSGTIYGPPPLPITPVQNTLTYRAVGQGSSTPPANPAVGLFVAGSALQDLGPGDFATGYSQGPTAPGDTCASYGLIDLLTPDAVSSIEFAYKNGNSQLVDLFYSSDGVTWTTVFTGHNASPPTTNVQNYALSVTARYLMVRLYGPYAVTLTDMRAVSAATGTYYPVVASFADSGHGTDTQGSGPLSTKSFADSAAATDAATKTVGRPTIQQGGLLAIASLGSSPHAALSGTWEVDWGAIDAGDSFTANGWLLTWDGTNITVNVPLSASPSIGTASFYTAYYESVAGAAPVYVQFDVMPGSVTVKAFTDSGAASDSLSQTGQLCSFTDSGHGSDALSLTATIAFTDSGGGSDAPIGPANPLAFSDSGTGADAISVGYTQQVADTGYAWEQLSINAGGTTTVYNLLADYGIGSDAPAVNATIPFTDAGAGSDTTGLIATIPFTDSGAASDVATAPVQFNPSSVQVFLD